MEHESASAEGAARPPWLGRSIERVEDAALLCGCGQYADDLGGKPGMLHAAVVRSPHAHAIVKAVDATAAECRAGVRAVLTAQDVRAWSQPFIVGVKQPMEHWCLAVDRVRYVGEPVVVVVASSRALAEDAADMVRVEYEVLGAVVDIDQALNPQAPVLHPEVGSNVVSDRSFRYGDPEAAFATAPHQVALTVRYPRNSCTPIECAVVVAEYQPADSAVMRPFNSTAALM